jgi:hypothetical protein
MSGEHVVKTFDERYDRRFAAPRDTDESNVLPRQDLEIEPTEDGNVFPRGIPEMDVLEFHFSRN